MGSLQFLKLALKPPEKNVTSQIDIRAHIAKLNETSKLSHCLSCKAHSLISYGMAELAILINYEQQ